MSNNIDQAALRKALASSPPTYPEWLDVGKLVYSNQHKTHGKVVGFLDRIINIEINGKPYQVDLDSITALQYEITTSLDLSQINHPTYRAIATDWLSELNGVKILPPNQATTLEFPTNLHPLLIIAIALDW